MAKKKKVSRGAKPTAAPRDLQRIISLLECLRDISPQGYGIAREAIDRLLEDRPPSSVDLLLFVLSCELSVRLVPGYATLHDVHLERLRDLEKEIKSYVGDTRNSRPLNFLMQARPGSGKSHFVKCLAKHLGSTGITAITFNMANMQSPVDLTLPLDSARTAKVKDKLPLIFLDEFDSNPANIALLLPLLWDGEITLEQKTLSIGKAVIILAGSDPDLSTAIKHARSMAIESTFEFKPAKLVDLLSRINGGEIEIPGFSPTLSDDIASPQYRASAREKVCTCVAILKHTFPRLKWVSVSFVKFISRVNLRYGPRSIEQIINRLIVDQNAEILSDTDVENSLPLVDATRLKKDALAIHLCDEDHSMGVKELWRECSRLKYYAYLNSDAASLPRFSDAETLQYFARRGLGLVDRDSKMLPQPPARARKGRVV